jgi:hypothetical protein
MKADTTFDDNVEINTTVPIRRQFTVSGLRI